MNLSRRRAEIDGHFDRAGMRLALFPGRRGEVSGVCGTLQQQRPEQELRGFGGHIQRNQLVSSFETTMRIFENAREAISFPGCGLTHGRTVRWNSACPEEKVPT